MSLPSELSSLREIEKFVSELCVEYKVSETLYNDILTAVLAAVSNAIQYGHKLHSARLFYIEFNLEEGRRMKVVVTDSGEGFDFKSIPNPTDAVNLEKEGGRGIYLMRELAHKCTFNKNGSEVILEFELGCS
jgi:serine/threonine-protein kinase RsbW